MKIYDNAIEFIGGHLFRKRLHCSTFDTECQVVQTQMWHHDDDQEIIEDIDPFFKGKYCLKQRRTKNLRAHKQGQN